jgi:hypothetical protein
MVINEQDITVSYFVYFTMLLFPKISVIVIDFLVIKRHRQVKPGVAQPVSFKTKTDL